MAKQKDIIKKWSKQKDVIRKRSKLKKGNSKIKFYVFDFSEDRVDLKIFDTKREAEAELQDWINDSALNKCDIGDTTFIIEGEMYDLKIKPTISERKEQ